MADSHDKWQVILTDSIKYDDNLFRRSSSITSRNPLESRQADFTNTTLLSGFFKYKYHRQLLQVNGSIINNQYFKNSNLNSLLTNDTILWKWQIGKYASGDLGYNYQNYQSSFTNSELLGKDLITEQTAYFDSHYSWHPNWQFRTGLNWIDSKHDVSSREFLNRQSYGVTLGFEHNFLEKNKIGLEYHFTKIVLPNLEPNSSTLIDNNSIKQTIELLFDWKVLKKSHLNARLGFAKNSYDKFSSRNFSGFTGKAIWRWDITSKLTYNMSVWRQLITAADITANYIIGQGVGIETTWKVSPKCNLFFNSNWENRDYAGDPGLFVTSFKRLDKLSDHQIGINYTPIQNVGIALAYISGTRTSNISGADYDYSTVIANVSIKF